MTLGRDRAKGSLECEEPHRPSPSPTPHTAPARGASPPGQGWGAEGRGRSSRRVQSER